MTQVSRRHLLAGALAPPLCMVPPLHMQQPLQISTSVPRQNSMKALISL